MEVLKVKKITFTARISEEKYQVLHNYLKNRHLRNSDWLCSVIDETIGDNKPIFFELKNRKEVPRPLKTEEIEQLKKFLEKKIEGYPA